jgi:hypothetical protein
MEPNYENLDPDERTNKLLAYLSCGVGLVSLCAGLIPVCGAAFSIAGIILGVLGMRSSNRKIGIVGIVISAMSLTVAIVYGILLVLKKA